MAKVDKTVFDAVINQHIAFDRYANSTVRDIISLLNRADNEIVDLIAKRGKADFTRTRLEALLVEIRRLNKTVYAELSERISDEMHDFAPVAAKITSKILSDYYPVSWNPVSISPEKLAAIVDSSPISIGTEKKLLLEEIFKSLAFGKEEKIRGALRLGMVLGESVDQMTRRLRGTKSAGFKDGILEISRRDAAAITRSIVVNTGNVAAQAVFDANSDVVKGWIYVATLDSRTCPVCFSQSGKKFPLGEGPMPIRHVQCRCSQVPDLKTWRELGFDKDELEPGKRSSETGLVKADISFHEWLKGQSAEVQTELLGPTRQKLFASGKLTLDKFTDRSGRLYNLAELKKIYGNI